MVSRVRHHLHRRISAVVKLEDPLSGSIMWLTVSRLDEHCLTPFRSHFLTHLANRSKTPPHQGYFSTITRYLKKDFNLVRLKAFLLSEIASDGIPRLPKNRLKLRMKEVHNISVPRLRWIARLLARIFRAIFTFNKHVLNLSEYAAM